MQLIAILMLLAIEAPIRAEPRVGQDVAAPKLACNIQMQKWCITDFNSKIWMSEVGDLRKWELLDRSNLGVPPMVISENIRCSFSNRTKVRKASESREQAQGGDEMLVIRYYLTELEDCPLIFEIPLIKSSIPYFYEYKLKSVLSCDLGVCAVQLPKEN